MTACLPPPTLMQAPRPPSRTHPQSAAAAMPAQQQITPSKAAPAGVFTGPPSAPTRSVQSSAAQTYAAEDNGHLLSVITPSKPSSLPSYAQSPGSGAGVKAPDGAPARPSGAAAAAAAAELAAADLSRALSLESWAAEPAAAGEPFGAWLESHRPPKASSSTAYGAEAVSGDLLPAAQSPHPTEALHFSSDDEDCNWLVGVPSAPAAASSLALLRTAVASPRAPPPRPALPAPPPPPPSPPSTRKSAASVFDRVFFAPWSSVADASTQAGTAAGAGTLLGGSACGSSASRSAGAGAGAGSSLAAAVRDPASAHFESFEAHFGASMPHLALALTSLEAAHGAASPLFAKAQFYLKTCLQVGGGGFGASRVAAEAGGRHAAVTHAPARLLCLAAVKFEGGVGKDAPASSATFVNGSDSLCSMLYPMRRLGMSWRSLWRGTGRQLARRASEQCRRRLGGPWRNQQRGQRGGQCRFT